MVAGIGVFSIAQSYWRQASLPPKRGTAVPHRSRRRKSPIHRPPRRPTPQKSRGRKSREREPFRGFLTRGLHGAPHQSTQSYRQWRTRIFSTLPFLFSFLNKLEIVDPELASDQGARGLSS